jgi:hypothetical protein
MLMIVHIQVRNMKALKNINNAKKNIVYKICWTFKKNSTNVILRITMNPTSKINENYIVT